MAKESGVINGKSNHGFLMSAENVLYVPTLRENLMSVKKLTKAGVVVVFQETQVIIKINGEIIATGKQRGNMYAIEWNFERANTSLAEVEYADLWHRRLGHISEGAMFTMIREDLALGVRFKPEKLKFCDVCVLGRYCREPFNGARDRSTRSLERIHSDVCEPIETPSWSSLLRLVRRRLVPFCCGVFASKEIGGH